MPKINLGYGKSNVAFPYETEQFTVLGGIEARKPLSDGELGAKLDQPYASPALEEIVKANETVLIVVPDATREVGCGQVLNLLVRRLISNGTMPFEINIIFATGIHRRVTDQEKEEILTPFINQRIKSFDHDARDLMQIISLGKTDDAIKVELNRKLTDYDHTIVIGGIAFHYFAGFTGGRKLICPGLASARTISDTHKLAFDFRTMSRREGVGAGALRGNPVHEGFVSVVEKCTPSFAINTIVDEKGAILDLICGHWKSSHEKACEIYNGNHTVDVSEKRELVVVSCGGSPYDLNLIQAHKSLEMASQACQPGGTIVFLAKCSNGLGREDFINWFEQGTSSQMAEYLCQKYQVNGQTAWSLRKKTEKFDIRILTELPEDKCSAMGFTKISDPDRIVSELSGRPRGYILPFGAKYRVIVK